MKNSKKSIYTLLKCFSLLLIAAFMLGSCQATGTDANSKSDSCDTVTEIEGEYICSGECVVTDTTGRRTLATVSGEIDKLQRFPGASEHLYQNNIVGSNSFHEIEIGALAGRTLRTATAEVSDGQFPVLEEYIFDTDPSCQAVGFTKIVRNPNPEAFKTCVIYCRKKR